jgi:hypothetical protein
LKNWRTSSIASYRGLSTNNAISEKIQNSDHKASQLEIYPNDLNITTKTHANHWPSISPPYQFARDSSTNFSFQMKVSEIPLHFSSPHNIEKLFRLPKNDE